jgi:tetrapyrrole methylase family protein/MazG family protein
MSTTAEKFIQLLEIMATLRGPGGCPWDKEQNHESLKKYMIEEAYEACEAIDSGQDPEVVEELGDVLLQVVFHAQVASEDGRYTIDDVLDAINTKLVSRHPHVFAEMKLENADQVLQAWEGFKVKEKKERKSILEGIPRQLPALMKAHRIQDRVARVGFDWEKIEDVFTKVREELREFEEACYSRDESHIEEELGDLFFALVNVARYLEKDPEAALQRTIRKFIRRFNYIEDRVKDSGYDLQDAPMEVMDGYWEEAKKKFRPEESKKSKPPDGENSGR